VSNRLAFERYALGNENSVLRPLSRSRSQSRRLLLSLCRLSARIWTELHEKAFRGLGGCARVVVLNNFERRRAASRRLRSHRQSTVSRCLRTLWCGGAAMPDPRSGPQGHVSPQEFALGIEALEHDLSAKTRFVGSTNASSECLLSKGSPSIRACRHNRLRSFRSIARNWYGQLDDK
jgi:hypothetical protein